MHAKINNVKTFYIFHVHDGKLLVFTCCVCMCFIIYISIFSLSQSFTACSFSVSHSYLVFQFSWFLLALLHSSRDIENDFIFLSALKSKKDIVFVPRFQLILWLYILTTTAITFEFSSCQHSSGFVNVHCCRAPRTFGIYYNLKHDPLFWHTHTHMPHMKERTNETKKPTEDGKMHKGFIWCSISIYALHVKYTNILWLSTLNPISFTARDIVR